jgi:UDP-N-acetylmuramyl tripeptide synthase
VFKDPEGFLRGREPGEVPGLLRSELEAQGLAANRLRVVLPEKEAVFTLLDWARAGDVLVLPVHGHEARYSVGARLNRLEAGGWSAGDLIF